MKKIIGILLMGVACSSFAAMAPTEEAFPIKKPSVTQMDASKRKIIRTEVKPTEKVSDETMKSLKRYEGILTMDNVRTIENMSALMQDNPAQLMRQLSVEDMNFEVDRHAMGSDEFVDGYVRPPETDDPAERFSNVQVPALTGSYDSVRSTQAELKQAHAEALKKIEEISHQHLGQKSTSVGMIATVDDIKAMGVDESLLPEGWEDQLNKAQEEYQSYKQKKITDQQKAGQAVSTVDAAKQQAAAAVQGQQATSVKTSVPSTTTKTTQSASKATQSAAKKSASTAKSAQTRRR